MRLQGTSRPKVHGLARFGNVQEEGHAAPSGTLLRVPSTSAECADSDRDKSGERQVMREYMVVPAEPVERMRCVAR